MHSGVRVGIVGDLNDQHKAHQAIPLALAATGAGLEAVWIATDSIGDGQVLGELDGLWCAPGMPYRDADGAMRAIRHARLTRTPFLGTSAGFQYALLEYARNTLGLSQADHQKSNPKAAMPLIAPLGCALAGVRARVRLLHGSKIRDAYGAAETVEEYHCSFGLNGRYRRLLEGGDMCVGATDDQGEIREVELDAHPFFAATLFQPELWALEARAGANPLIAAFASACRQKAERGAAKTAG